MWSNEWRPMKVTLARVFGIEDGETYRTIPFTLMVDRRGEHMREVASMRSMNSRVKR